MRDKRIKFVEIAEKRVNRLIKEIRLLGNLSNKNNYIFDKSDVSKIYSAIESEMKIMRNRFDVAISTDDKGFHLK